MRWPDGATAVEIHFGIDVRITSGSGFWGEPGTWTVWNSKRVRQGARMVRDGLNFAEACALAKSESEEGQEG